MSDQSVILKDGCRTAIISPRTFGGYRISMNDWYFEIITEEYTDTYEQAKAIGEAWLANDNKND